MRGLLLVLRHKEAKWTESPRPKIEQARGARFRMLVDSHLRDDDLLLRDFRQFREVSRKAANRDAQVYVISVALAENHGLQRGVERRVHEALTIDRFS